MKPLVVYKLIKFIKKKQHSIEISKITLTELVGVYRDTYIWEKMKFTEEDEDPFWTNSSNYILR